MVIPASRGSDSNHVESQKVDHVSSVGRWSSTAVGDDDDSAASHTHVRGKGFKFKGGE